MQPAAPRSLATCEAIIERTKGSFIECGRALAEIRDGRKYLEGWKTFEEYCKDRWGWKRAHAYRMIEAASTMSPMGDKTDTDVKPGNERQARELAHVEPEQREAVMAAAAAAGPVTAAGIRTAARRAAAPKPKVIDLDETGTPIPESIIEDWRKAESVADLLRDVRAIMAAIERGLDMGHLWAEVGNSTLIDFKNGYRSLKRVIPYAVCPSCGGHNRAKCTLCSKRGWISKFLWDTAIPQETKAIREKAKK